MPFQIVRNDLTKMTTDAIVNTSNPYPLVGTGTDSAGRGWEVGILQAGLKF